MKSQAETRSKASASESPSASGTRVDPPHRLGQPPVADEPATISRIERQVNQLSDHLSARQDELDQREASVNARAAELEQQTRQARLWLNERQYEFDERGAELSHREEQFESRCQRWTKAQNAGNAAPESLLVEVRLREEKQDRREMELSEREHEIDRREAQMDDRQASHERRAASMEETFRQLEAQKRQLAEKKKYCDVVDQLSARTLRLEKAESQLAEGHADLERRRNRLNLQQQQTAADVRQEQQQAQARASQLEKAWQKKLDSLLARQEQLAARDKALQQLRTDLAASHREAMEMRLAVEEVWAQLAGANAPAALSQSLGQVRARLADHYRMSNNELAERRDEISRLIDRLAEAHEKLGSRKQELEKWVSQRQHDIETQAARLVAREQELDRQQSRYDTLEEQWDSQRQDLERQNRTLAAELRQTEAALA